MSEINNKITNITNLATATDLTSVENKVPDVSNLITKTDYSTKIIETENEITTDHDHDKYITTQEFNKLTSRFHCKISTSEVSKQKWYFYFREKGIR